MDSTYAKSVWNGTVTGTDTLPINSANWGQRAYGAAVCTSGRSTGQKCRFFVTNPETSISVAVPKPGGGTSTLTFGYVVVMRHDDTQSTTGSDSNGFSGGDSGGPCYYADGNGGVEVLGIVSASVDTAAGRRYYCTLLKGFRQWAPSATLP
jgi:hypothetical protein